MYLWTDELHCITVLQPVPQARRSLKRESKVQLSDEIIFFDDVAGNEQAKVGAAHHLIPSTLCHFGQLSDPSSFIPCCLAAASSPEPNFGQLSNVFVWQQSDPLAVLPAPLPVCCWCPVPSTTCVSQPSNQSPALQIELLEIVDMLETSP